MTPQGMQNFSVISIRSTKSSMPTARDLQQSVLADWNNLCPVSDLPLTATLQVHWVYEESQ